VLVTVPAAVVRALEISGNTLTLLRGGGTIALVATDEG
jgi:hypothetical protein